MARGIMRTSDARNGFDLVDWEMTWEVTRAQNVLSAVDAQEAEGQFSGATGTLTFKKGSSLSLD